MGIDPVSLSLAASLAGAAIGGAGAIEQGEAASKAAAYQSQVATQNAQIAKTNAQFAGAEGETNAAASELQTKSKVAAITAAQGANGINVNTGSAVDVRQSASELGELDALNIRANAARSAYGYETQGAADTGQAAVDKSTSQNDATAGIIGGSATLLSGAGNAGLNFARLQGSNGLTTDDLNAPNAASTAAGGANNVSD